MEHTRITSWKFDNAISEKDYNRYYEKDTVSKNSEESVSKVTTEGNSIGKLRPWRLEKKSRGRKSSRISGFNREDKITKRNTAQSGSNRDNVRSYEDDTRSSTAHRPGRRAQDSQERLTSSTVVLKPSKPAVTWQSLMAASRCQLDEVRVPGYDQFLMNTKNYELAKDVNKETVSVIMH